MAVKRICAVVLAAMLLVTAGFPRFALAKSAEESAPIVTALPLPENSPAPSESADPLPENSPAPSESADPLPENSPPPSESADPLPENSPPPSESTDPPPENGLPPSENAPPALPPTAPAFAAELLFKAGEWGVVGTISEMTANMTAIIPCYSLDGVEYFPEAYNFWELDPNDSDFLRQQCFWPGESPLREYLTGEVDRFHVKLEITYEEGVTVFTNAVTFERTGPAPLPEKYRVEAWFATPIREITYRPLSIRGQYHFTVADTATAEELTALLPEMVPVELQIYPDGSQTPHMVVVDYAAQWPEIPALSGDTEILATGVTPPKVCTITLGSSVYYLAPPEILPEDGPELWATFHPVAADGAAEVLLSTDESTEVGGIRVTFPQKPTGAVTIVPEYSLDGESGWTALEDVLADAPLEKTPPRFESYTVRILSNDAPPLAAYLNQEIPGFYVRLCVEGGALAGTTAAAAWPADYDYVPPRDDSNDQGAGGNENNAGSGGGKGDGADSGTNGGQRPGGLPEERPPAGELPPQLPEEPVVPLPTAPAAPAESSAAPVQGDAGVPGDPNASQKLHDKGVAGSGGHLPLKESDVPAALPEVPQPPRKEEKPPDTGGGTETELSTAEQALSYREETPKGAPSLTTAPAVAAGAILVGGGAVAVCSGGGGAGLADAGRRLLAAIKQLLKISK